MAEYKVTVNEDLIPVLEAMAHAYGLASVDEVLSKLLGDQLAELEASKDDPLIGMISSGRSDVSERNEELLYRPRSDE